MYNALPPPPPYSCQIFIYIAVNFRALSYKDSFPYLPNVSQGYEDFRTLRDHVACRVMRVS